MYVHVCEIYQGNEIRYKLKQCIYKYLLEVSSILCMTDLLQNMTYFQEIVSFALYTLVVCHSLILQFLLKSFSLLPVISILICSKKLFACVTVMR